MRLTLSASLGLAVALGAFVSACEGCRSSHSGPGPDSPNGPTPSSAHADVGPSTLRLYIVSDVAGALEPCGCVKDQLGGVDHAAALLAAEREKSGAAVLLAAGPLFFMDPVVEASRRAQEEAKAQTLADILKGMGLVAFAPGKNDGAAGDDTLRALAARAGVEPGSGAAGLPGAKAVVRQVGTVKLGLVTVGAGTEAPADVVKREAAAARQGGAQVVVAVTAVGRGEAKRIAEAVPDLTAVVVGSVGGSGEANTSTPPAEQVGNVLILETGNHLQTLGVLDLFVREGSFTFADATGLEDGRKREELGRRIQELRGRIAGWEKDGAVAKADLDARRADVARLEAERNALGLRPPPAKGSFFRYGTREVRDGLGREPGAADKMSAYYKYVNDANRVAFASKLPPPVPEGQSGFAGIEACTTCHGAARAVWNKTPHAHAYATLADQFKEFNLDCVSCHVTGYDRPGGSTVTHVDGLKDVQCEVCHGPGARHAKTSRKTDIVGKPGPDLCTSACHHPPHVHTFDATAKMSAILGPGHGRPL